MGMFFAGSLACALAPSFALLLAGRIIQACGAGVLMTLLQTVLFRVYPPERRGQAMSMFAWSSPLLRHWAPPSPVC